MVWQSFAPTLTVTPRRLAQGVAFQRFRDVSGEIRTLVIGGLGDCIVAHPAAYLRDSYLKYLGWALSDRVGAPYDRTALLSVSSGNLSGIRGGLAAKFMC